MEYPFIPPFYHPLKLVLVDDDQRLLNGLKLKFGHDRLLDVYTDPKAALDALWLDRSASALLSTCLHHHQGGDVVRGHSFVDIDFEAIERAIYQPSRFDTVGVLLTDYAMPNLNGLELCEALHQHPVRRIMLTGEADQHDAVRAFNSGLIDRFIMKSAPNYTDQLTQAIDDMLISYFTTLTHTIVDALRVEGSTCLDDPAFITFFLGLCAQHDIVEYYMLDASGSFLMLDGDGKPYWLIMKTEDDFQVMIELAEGDGADAHMLNRLHQREAAFPILTEKDALLPAADWGPRMIEVQRLEGQATYHYALRSDFNTGTFIPGRVTSFFAHLRSHLSRA